MMPMSLGGRSRANKYSPCKHHRYQRGAALLGITLVLIVAAASALLAQLNQRRVDASGASSVAHAFNEARAALIGYSYSYPEVVGDPLTPPGAFPCPDFNGDGDADSPCNAEGETSIGRLPWRTLGLPPLRDADSECLWYVVSSTYKASAALPPASDSDGQLLIENENGALLAGSSNGNRAIVALFAAGRPVASQLRDVAPANQTECGANNNAQASRPGNYLDVFNAIDNSRGTRAGAGAGSPGSDPLPAVAASVFVSAQPEVERPTTDFNDRLSWIAPSEMTHVYERMDRWVANRVTQCLLAYGNSHPVVTDRYPWAASLNATGPVEYFDDSGERFGRIPAVLTSTAASNPAMNANWPVDPLDASATCFSWPWWSQWREQVFYAVADSQAPVVGTGANPEVDGSDVNFLVIVAGRALSGQSRSNAVAMGQIENYLEGDNQPSAGTGRIPSGDEAFITGQNGSNDTICDSSGCPFVTGPGGVTPPPGGEDPDPETDPNDRCAGSQGRGGGLERARERCQGNGGQGNNGQGNAGEGNNGQGNGGQGNNGQGNAGEGNNGQGNGGQGNNGQGNAGQGNNGRGRGR